MHRHSLYQPDSVNQLSLWHLSRQHLSWQHLSISGISQLLLIQFSPNFKGRIFGPCLKDANCYGDICPGNICPGDICPYKQYLSCYWSDFDQTFWTQFFWSHNFLDQNVLCQNFSKTQNFIRAKSFIPDILLDPKNILN